MATGISADRSLAGLLATDEFDAYRQVGMVDRSGGVAAHTGSACIPEAGHLLGEGFSVQANMMASESVWPAMAAAFRRAEGSLARRLHAALEAAQAEGGDWRGQRSGAILVVAAQPSGRPW